MPDGQDQTAAIGSRLRSVLANSQQTLPTQVATKFKVKACDLESAVAVGAALRDFSPETCAPEQADVLSAGQLSVIGGRSADFKLNLQEPLIAAQSLDIWSLGVSMLQLYTGRYDPH